ncbi:MAG: class I SAM-dependent methyltransferase [Elusimicrobia bacterium]|nr:class I SAM-dependent methyltransferase [Elusimicrobiota bacterium]
MSLISERNARYFPDFVPGHEVYLRRAAELAPVGGKILHLGAGRDAMGVVARLSTCSVTAVDPDERGLALNPAPTKLKADGEELPFVNASFDMVLCEHVFEHLERPAAVLSECSRVLRPGGRLLFLTPNRWSYIAVAAALTPYRFHIWFRSMLIGTAEVDTFPTIYRINTRRDIQALGHAAGLRLEWFESFVGCPTYLETGEWLHRFGVGLHLLLERLPEPFHISFAGSLRKE